MVDVWQLQEAKARFSEVVDTALKAGPQTITRHGRDAVVVVSAETWRREHEGGQSLVEFFRSAPRVELTIERSMDGDRPCPL